MNKFITDTNLFKQKRLPVLSHLSGLVSSDVTVKTSGNLWKDGRSICRCSFRGVEGMHSGRNCVWYSFAGKRIKRKEDKGRRGQTEIGASSGSGVSRFIREKPDGLSKLTVEETGILPDMQWE